MNKVILIGRLTADPELRYTPSGAAVCSFRIAVDRPFNSQSGEREADFINIVVWNKAAENTAKYMSKGRQIAVEGRLQIRSYDGQRRSAPLGHRSCRRPRRIPRRRFRQCRRWKLWRQQLRRSTTKQLSTSERSIQSAGSTSR